MARTCHNTQVGLCLCPIDAFKGRQDASTDVQKVLRVHASGFPDYVMNETTWTGLKCEVQTP
jgi:hypothetical protein